MKPGLQNSPAYNSQDCLAVEEANCTLISFGSFATFEAFFILLLMERFLYSLF